MFGFFFQLNYPSALSSFGKILHFAKGKRLALFLDYDGTLSPIVDNPDLAFMSDDVTTNSFNDQDYARLLFFLFGLCLF